MGHLAQVSRAGFYRSWQAHQPMEEDMDVRTAIEGIARRPPGPVWLPAPHSGTPAARPVGEPQTGGAAHAGRQPAGGPTAGLRGHDRYAG
jgi:hypothetical protein